MKVYTRKGDSGETSLIGGIRISKASLRIESYGTVDELNSYLGLIRDLSAEQKVIDQILEIQDRLFTLGSMLASAPDKSKMTLPPFGHKDTSLLEKWMDEMDQDLPPMRFFVLPGGHVLVSHTHVARCICRRAERLIVHLMETEKVDPEIEKYMNRLSDYLFVLSRWFSHTLQAEEKPWHPRKEN